jgi:hypothetical protein
VAYLSTKLTTVSDVAALSFEPDVSSHNIGELIVVHGTNDVGTTAVTAVNGTSATELTIVNPGAELGTVGWTNETGALAVGTSNGAVSGTYYFNGGTSPLTVAYQDVDVSAYAVAIDAGTASFYLSYWASGFASDGDTIEMRVAWLNAANAVTATINGTVTNGATTWTNITSTNAIPVG